MTASDTTAVLVGAAIGAGGAVLAQITSSIFSGRHDTKRLEWEQLKEAREWDRRRAERFLDLKRELYSDFGAQASQWSSYISRSQDPPEMSRPKLPDIEKLHHVVSNINLIAPFAVWIKVEMAELDLIDAVFSTFAGPEQVQEKATKARASLAGAKAAMGFDLRGDERRRVESAPFSR